MKLWLTDPVSKQPSVTLTAFMAGFLTATAKLLVAGMTIKGFEMAAFTGVDYAAAVGALGAIYVMRRSVDQK